MNSFVPLTIREKKKQFRGDLSKFHSQLTFSISFVPFGHLKQKSSVTPLHRCRNLGTGEGVGAPVSCQQEQLGSLG